MSTTAQDKFRRKVKRYLLDREESVTEFAARLSERRDTVSTAIHNARFPHIRAKIAAAIAKPTP